MTTKNKQNYALDNIRYDSKSNKFYKYNRKTRLWGIEKPISLTEKLYDVCMDYISQESDKDTFKIYNDILETIGKQKSVLQSAINMIMHKNRYDDFSKLIDSKEHYFPYGNQLMNLKTGENRKIQRDDYFSKSTNNTYIVDWDRTFVYDYFKSVLNTEDMDYVKMAIFFFAYGMTNSNKLKFFFCHVGTGNNGKSLFMALLLKIFGDHSGSINEKCVFNNKTSSNHDSELFSLFSIRLGCFSDNLKLGQHSKFNDGTIKSVTGNDEISIRKAGSSKNTRVKFKTQLHLFLNTNCLPESNDQALLNRLITIDWSNTFKKDSGFETKLFDQSDHFFSCFIDILKEKYNGSDEIDAVEFESLPNQMKLFAEKHKKGPGDIKTFLSQYAPAPKPSGGKINGSCLFILYKEYCNANNFLCQFSTASYFIEYVINNSSFDYTNLNNGPSRMVFYVQLNNQFIEF